VLKIVKASGRFSIDFLKNPGGPSIALALDMKPQTQALQARTHFFFVRVIKLCQSVPDSPAGRSICNQLLDSAGSADSNYRAACKARSKKEFIAKMGVAAEEADESLGWLTALRDAALTTPEAAAPLIAEANELASIFVASAKTAAENLAQEERRGEQRRTR
jgi:four helix bundle protein